MPEKFLFDANIFVQSKNREYRFEFAAAYWEWIEAAHKQGVVFSTKKVFAELQRGPTTCPLRKWANGLPKGFFLDDDKNKGAMKRYAEVMAWAYAQPQYTQKAVADFADRNNADAFLIAVAKHTGMTIVTHEAAAQDSKVRIPIPNAAGAMGVKTVLLFDVLSAHATSTFNFKR